MTPLREDTRLIRPPAFRGLSTRVALFASLVVFIVLGALGLAVESNTAARVHTEFRSRSVSLLEVIAVPSAFDVALGNIERLDDTLTEVTRVSGQDLGLLFSALLDERGAPIVQSDGGTWSAALATYAPERGKAFAAEGIAARRGRWEYVVRDDASDLLLVTMPVVSGLRWGTLFAVFDCAQPEERVAWTRAAIGLGAALLAIALVIALHLGVRSLVIRPLRQLSAAVRDIQAGELGARADIDSTTELGQLAAGFNAMASELEAHTRDLQHRVEARTAEVQRKQEALAEANHRLEVAVQELATLARTDGLTGLCNRRHFLELFTLEVRRARRRGGRLGLAMLDVDHFKRVNDGFGHAAGDEVLKVVAEVLRRAVRETDLVARYGGEEFVVVLLDTEEAAGLSAVRRICKELEMQRVIAPDGRVLPTVTMSGGYVDVGSDARSPEELLGAADAALYAAKAGGRNRVEVAPAVGQNAPGHRR